jgi:hypothetical protein
MTTGLDGGKGPASRPSRSFPRERPSTHCKGGWVGPRAGLDRCGKSRPPPGFARTVQPVASRYTYYATRPIRRGGANNFIIPVTFSTVTGQFKNKCKNLSFQRGEKQNRNMHNLMADCTREQRVIYAVLE